MFEFFKSRKLLPEWQENPYRIGKVASGRTILVTGATSVVGRKICRTLIDRGDRLIVLVRNKKKAVDIFGPHAMVVTSLDVISRGTRVDSVVHLAGSWFWRLSAQGRKLAELVKRGKLTPKRSSGLVVNWMAPFL